MRKFVTWVIGITIVGALMAGGGAWAWWNWFGRFQPVTISENQTEIQRLLESTSWVGPEGGAGRLYVIGYRDSEALQRYEAEEAPKLAAAGVQVRSIVFAQADKEGLAQSTPAERATVAELWSGRDYALYQRWLATPTVNWTAAGIPAADGNLARTSIVEASRVFVGRLNDQLRPSRVPQGYPLILWRDPQGFLKACACSDARGWAFIRDDLNAPDQIDRSGDVVTAPPLEDGGSSALPYPNVPPPAPQTQNPTPTPARPAAPSAPRPTPARPATPAPESQIQPQTKDDSLFY